MLCSIFSHHSNNNPSVYPLPKNFQDLLFLVQSELGVEASSNYITLKYMDCEQDFINLKDEQDFQTAILLTKFEQQNILRVYVIYSMDKQSSYLASHVESAQKLGLNNIRLRQETRKIIRPEEFSRSKNRTCPLPASGCNNIKGLFSGLNKNSTALSYIEKSRRKVRHSAKVYLELLGEDQINLRPRERYQVSITVENTGTEPWPCDIRICCVNGIYKGREEILPPLDSNNKQTFNLCLQAPNKANKYLTQWRLQYREGQEMISFGDSLFIQSLVRERSDKLIDYQDGTFVNQKMTANLFRRAKILIATFISEINEKKGQPEKILNDKRHVAEWLSGLFPGDLQDKLNFLENNSYSGKEEDLTTIVCFYLQSLVGQS